MAMNDTRPLIDLSIVPIENDYDERDREVFSLRLNEGRTFQSIATELGISVDRVRQLYMRCRRHLAYPCLLRSFDYRKMLHISVKGCHKHLVYYNYAKTKSDRPEYNAAIAELYLPGMKPWRVIELMNVAERIDSRIFIEEINAEHIVGKIVPVWDRFSAAKQQWTPESQYHETRTLTGAVE